MEFADLVLEQLNNKAKVYDQLDRASTSIVLNIAEGNGKFSSKDRCRYFDIARGSALESAACLDLAVRKKFMSIDEIRESKELLNEIVSMLVGLIKSNSDRVYEPSENYNELDKN